MAEKPAFNLLVPIEYGEGPNKRTRWVQFGAVWETDNGNFAGKVDFWPVGASGNRVVLMPPKGQGDDADAAGDDPF